MIYDHDRDEPKPEQVVDPAAVEGLNTMLHQVVLSGTGRRANLDGFLVSGKTGTTNDYHDAWFMGFTGNYVAGVWFGNDDYAGMKEMTGGTLPAQTWHEIMAYAHQNVEPKPVPGLPAAPAVAVANTATPTIANGARPPATLSKASVDALTTIATSMHVAEMGRPSTKIQGMSLDPMRDLASTDAIRGTARIIDLR